MCFLISPISYGGMKTCLTNSQLNMDKEVIVLKKLEMFSDADIRREYFIWGSFIRPNLELDKYR